jgi:hypothetical protein
VTAHPPDRASVYRAVAAEARNSVDRRAIQQAFIDAGQIWHCITCDSHYDPIRQASCCDWVAVPSSSMRPGFRALSPGATPEDDPIEILVLSRPTSTGQMKARRLTDGREFMASTPPKRLVRVTRKQWHENRTRLDLIRRVINHAAAVEAGRRAIKESRFAPGGRGTDLFAEPF